VAPHDLVSNWGRDGRGTIKEKGTLAMDTAQDHDLRISHIAIDRKHTTAEDSATYFPLTGLRQRASASRIGSVAHRAS
jgi:hypothetical protein